MQDISHLGGLIDLLVEAVLREIQAVGVEEIVEGPEGKGSRDGEQHESHE